MNYSPQEIMTIAAAKMISDRDIVFCGTGISMIAAMAAKHINAPNSYIFFETGAIDADLEEVPLAVADPRVMFGAAVNGSLVDAFATMQNPKTGPRVIGIVGAAQIDRHGNFNSTCIGNYLKPKIRFPGSGGACDVASSRGRFIIFMQHEKRKFVKKLDYKTSPGWLTGYNARKKFGFPDSSGPLAVITNLGVMKFGKVSKEMFLDGFYPGNSPEQILENMEFEVDISKAKEYPSPTKKEISILRNTCDPQGLIL
jgi:glutaconate CoA-transferase subunit B